MSNYEYICQFIEVNFISFVCCFGSLALLIVFFKYDCFKINKKIIIYYIVCILFTSAPIWNEIIKLKSFLNVNLLPYMLTYAVLDKIDLIGCSMFGLSVLYIVMKQRLSNKQRNLIIILYIIAVTAQIVRINDFGPYDNPPHTLNLVDHIQYIRQYAEEVKDDNTQTVYAEKIEFVDKYNHTIVIINFANSPTLSLSIGRNDIDYIKEMKKDGGIFITYYSNSKIIKSISTSNI